MKHTPTQKEGEMFVYVGGQGYECMCIMVVATASVKRPVLTCFHLSWIKKSMRHQHQTS